MTQQQINYTTSPRHHFTPSVNTVERYHQRRTIKAALLEQENCRNAHLCSLPRPSSYPTYSTPFQNAQENYIAEWEQKQNDRFNIEKKRIMQKREESRKRKVEREEHQKKITMSIIKRRQEIILREMTNLNLIFAQSQRESQNERLAVEEDLDVLNLEILPSLTFDEDDLPFEDEEESNELFDALEILSAKTFDEDEDEADERDDEEGDSAKFEVNVRTLMPSEDEWVNLVIKSSKTFDEDDEEGKGKNEGHDELSIVEQDVLSPSSSHSLVLQDSTIHNRFSTVAIDRQY